MSAPDELEMTLLGLAVFQAQRLEFGLYGLAAHCSHLPQAKKERRFRDLTPEKFLRGDYTELKSTLGQIVTVFGERFLLNCDDLDKLVEDRNFIFHNLFRFYHANGPNSSQKPHGFLQDFNERAENWFQILSGLYSEVLEAFARKEGRLDEIQLTERDFINRQKFHEHVRSNQKPKN